MDAAQTSQEHYRTSRLLGRSISKSVVGNPSGKSEIGEGEYSKKEPAWIAHQRMPWSANMLKGLNLPLTPGKRVTRTGLIVG